MEAALLTGREIQIETLPVIAVASGTLDDAVHASGATIRPICNGRLARFEPKSMITRRQDGR